MSNEYPAAKHMTAAEQKEAVEAALGAHMMRSDFWQNPQHMARLAYQHADAMMDERKRAR